MKVVIDTSSLLALVRYYSRFDTNKKMYDFIRSEIESGRLIVIDEVLNECIRIGKGVVVKTLDYLVDKAFQKQCKIPIKTSRLVAPSPKKFLNQVDNNFRAPGAKKLDEVTYQIRKSEYLNSVTLCDSGGFLLILNQRVHSSNQGHSL